MRYAFMRCLSSEVVIYDTKRAWTFIIHTLRS